MKVSFCQLFLFLFLIINLFQCQTCLQLFNNQNRIYQKLYDATQRTLSTLLSPLCYQLLFNQNNIQSQYISPKGLTGRIIPAGTFPSQVLALEYLYGILCPIPNFPPQEHVVQTIDLVHVAYNKNYLITQNEFVLNLTGNIRLTFFANMAFDKNHKLCGYDGQIRNFGLTFDTYTEAEHQTKINLLCAGVQRFCNGSLQQYASVNACIQYLTTNVPYGSYDRADQGNVVCRLIHIKFAPLLPSVHCPHVGPTGGGACVDKKIDFYYNQTNFLACAHRYN